MILCSELVSLSAILALQAAADGGGEHRPKYAFLRQAEDWSKFRAADPPVDVFDPLKHVPLDEDGDVWVSFGGRAEARLESWYDFNFGAPPTAETNDEFIVSRVFLHSDIHFGRRVRLWLEGKTAQATDRDLPGGRRDLDLDTAEVQQAFVDVVLPVGDGEITLRGGRQMLLFGVQRLISPLPWGNTLRHWDGITADWRTGKLSINVFATAFAPVDKTGFNDTDEDVTLFGVYAKGLEFFDAHPVELYAIGNERPDVTVNGTTGDETRVTLGGRFTGPLGERGDYEVEGGWQTGEVGDGDVNAWFLATQTGWKPADGLGKPRFWLGLDLASGDKEPGGDVETFHQLFPLGHAYLGYIDVIGRQNIFGGSVGGKWNLDENTTAALSTHLFRVLDEDDALYNAGGVAYRSGFDSRDVGVEFDALFDRKFGRHVSAYLGYSHFVPGEAIEETGPDEDIDFVYLGISTTF